MLVPGDGGRRPPAFHRLTVSAIEPLCSDAVAVTFAVPAELADDYAFTAGQSLTLRRGVEGEEQRRSYSISAPEGGPLRIGVREIPGGVFSSWLVRDVAPGTQIEVQTPTGGFGAHRPPGGRHLCIAAGSGITPVLSIAGTALAGDPTTQVALVYGNRGAGTVMFAEALGDLKNRYGPRLQLVHVLSREPAGADLFSGRLDTERLRRLLTSVVPAAGTDHAWLCGPLALVEDARTVLAELGLPPDQVHFELFHVDEPPPGVRRVRTGGGDRTSRLTVVLDGRSTETTADRDVRILDSARAARPDVPFACTAGVCGTCRALVRDGAVEMRRNYALERAELDAGFVLTCQARPVTDRVTVDYDA